jgi:hypothetical protein
VVRAPPPRSGYGAEEATREEEAMSGSKGGFGMKSITGSKSTLIAVISALVALIGSFLAWASIDLGPVSVSVGGMESGNDGIITFIVAIATAAAAIFLKEKARMISVLIGGAVILVVALINLFDIMGEDLVKVGFGLWLVVLGGAGALVAAFIKD